MTSLIEAVEKLDEAPQWQTPMEEWVPAYNGMKDFTAFLAAFLEDIATNKSGHILDRIIRQAHKSSLTLDV
ncbi:MAG TPA: hypothetical protein EYN67_00080 [Flavobacteriales bacterium]|nr:hypothetical protein [Flavobacteriales bacterium]